MFITQNINKPKGESSMAKGKGFPYFTEHTMQY